MIVSMRRLVVLGMIAELTDQADEYDRLLAAFDEIARDLPLWVVWRDGVSDRVIEPSRRKVDREGILAQSSNANHQHQMTRQAEIETWACECGFAYMPATRPRRERGDRRR